MKKVYTLCGSTRFPEAFEIANAHLTLMGHVVISLGAFGHVDRPSGIKHIVDDGDENNRVKMMLDKLHFEKIDMCDSIMVINFGNYIGSSLAREIQYARDNGKGVEYFFPTEYDLNQ